MATPIQFAGEDRSNKVRETITTQEPIALRTYTPSQAVFAKSAGCYHWTPEGRRLYDFSSGVLVANLGHNPRRWMKRFAEYMKWEPEHLTGEGAGDYFEAVTLTAYNAITEIEAQSVARLVSHLGKTAGGEKLDTIMWAASGSEAVQKALWACLHRDHDRDLIIATRYGFHGKKGLAGAVTGSEKDKDRDPRVKFISFPREECDDTSKYGDPIDLAPYKAELDALYEEYGWRLNCLITEPYLGGGGSYHPPAEYLQMLVEWCNEKDVMFILDEVQANFGRTGKIFAFEKYGITPDFVCMGKGLGNGIPVAAVAGRNDVMASLKYGEASDTWSASPIACAAVLATLDEFEQGNVMENTQVISKLFFDGLEKLKDSGVIAKVRGEGLVFGIECAPMGDLSSNEVAVAVVKKCYEGQPGGDGIHFLGPLSGNVLRVSPPQTMTTEEANASLALLHTLVEELAAELKGSTVSA
ncbi:MAG: aspartate aminotransferase family protein [Planctomyces sp.]|nr:aspartate aminotransferase family protein [Planctomyces sp.]